MRSVIPRHGRVLALIAAVGLLLAGCSGGASQVGAAAFVGDTRIPVSEVQSRFEAALRKEPQLKQQWQQQGQLATRSRQLVSYLVRDELLTRAAREESLAVSEQRITDAISGKGGAEAMTQGSLLSPADVRESVRASLLAAELGRKYVDRLAITFDYTQATNRHEAETKARRMAEGPDQSAAVLEADRRQGIPVSLNERLRAADNPELAAMTPLFGARPGTVVAFEPQPQSGQWVIARITQRDTQAAGQARVNVDDQTLEAIGTRLLALTADRVGVRLSPRYGVWDQVDLSAAANANETTGFWFHDSKSAAR